MATAANEKVTTAPPMLVFHAHSMRSGHVGPKPLPKTIESSCADRSGKIRVTSAADGDRLTI
jgi:hypothetical protein